MESERTYLIQEEKVYTVADGLTNRDAVLKIMQELRKLIEQKASHFKDHKQNIRQKTLIALKRLVHPFTLLTFGYLGTLVYNMISLRSIGLPIEPAPFLTVVVISLLVVFDVYLQIQGLN